MNRFSWLVHICILWETLFTGWCLEVKVFTDCSDQRNVRLCASPEVLTLEALEITVTKQGHAGLEISCPFTVPNATLLCGTQDCDIYTPKVCETIGSCEGFTDWNSTTSLVFKFTCDIPDNAFTDNTDITEITSTEATEVVLEEGNTLKVLIPICVVVPLLLICGIIPLIIYCRKRRQQELAKLEAVAKSLPCSNGEMASYSFTYENKYDFIGISPDGKILLPSAKPKRPPSSNSDEIYPTGVQTLTDNVFPDYYASKILRGHVQSKKTRKSYENNLNALRAYNNGVKRKSKIEKMKNSINCLTIPEGQDVSAEVHTQGDVDKKHPYVNVPPPVPHQYENVPTGNPSNTEPSAQYAYAELDISPPQNSRPYVHSQQPRPGSIDIYTHKEVHLQYAQIRK